jgi:hypothetical protein
MPQACDDAKTDGIADADHDDWHRCARAPGGERGRRPGSNQHPDAGADQLLHNRGQLLGSLLGPAVENRDGAAVGPTERGESLTERIEKPLVVLRKAGLDKADARHLGLGRGRVPIDRRSRREQHEPAAV